MKTKKLYIPILAALAIIVGTVATMQTVSAQEAEENRKSQIAGELSEEFGIDQSALETFFEEKHEERKAEMEERRSQTLDEAVADGVITAEQKDALLLKKEEMKSEMQALRAEFQSWAESEGIDLEELKGYGKGHKGFGKKMGGHFGGQR